MKLMREWPRPLADASEPLGKLQRGLGSGFLWAVDAGREVAGELVERCLVEDPRWDRQLDHRDEYYATLALRLDLDLGRLEGWLRESIADPPSDDARLETLFGVLGRMAIRGHREARRVLRSYVSYGRVWEWAIATLSFDYELMRPARDWQDAVAGLDRVILERYPDDDELANELWEMGPRFADDPPWCNWSKEHPRIARALSAIQDDGVSGSGEPPAGRPELRAMRTADLLAIEDDRTSWVLAGQELATRTSPGDPHLIIAAASHRDLVMRPAAVYALGLLGRRELLELAEPLVAEDKPRSTHVALSRALEAMPFSQTRALAHRWLESPDSARRRKAAGILAEHADDAAAEVRRALASELNRGLAGDQYVVCLLAQALGRSRDRGPFPELHRAYEEMPYSFGRRWVVSAMAATDPAFKSTTAVECLWDCETEIRETAVGIVDRRHPEAAQRLVEIAGDELQPEAIRSAADHSPPAP